VRTINQTHDKKRVIRCVLGGNSAIASPAELRIG